MKYHKLEHSCFKETKRSSKKYQINRLQHIQNPECSFSNCCPGSSIPTHHSYSEISSLA